MCGLNITLNASEKSLKEQIIAFMDKIKQEIEVINTMDNKIEILTEYKQNLDLRKSILTVCERKEKIAEELKKQQEKVEQKIKEETQATAEVLQNFIPKQDEIIAPKVIQEEEKQYEMTFTIRGTMAQLKSVKEFLKKENLLNEKE